MKQTDRPTGGQGGALAQPLMFPPLARAAAHLGLFALGAVVGLVGGLLKRPGSPADCCSRCWARPGSSWGVHGRRTAGRGPLHRPCGWMISVVLLTSTRPEGDFLFGAGVGSYLFLLGGMAVAVMCATLGWGRQPTGPDARLGK